MRTLRRYVFAFVAVCAAFAAGIALGNGPLQGNGGTGSTAALGDANNQLRGQLAAAHKASVFPRALADASGSVIVHGMLTSQSIGIVVLPGVAKPDVEQAVQAVRDAGGELVWTLTVGTAVLDPTRKTYVDSVSTNTAKGLTDLGSNADASPYTRMGSLLARAYTGPADALAVDNEAIQIDAQLRGAKVVSITPALQRKANGVVVLAPGDHGTGDEAVYAQHQIESQLVTELATRCDGLLLATPAGAAAPGGLLTSAALRSGPDAFGTLDLLGTPAAGVAEVGGLASVLSGRPGSFGMVNGEPVVPPALIAGG